jgi:hypothetical protein
VVGRVLRLGKNLVFGEIEVHDAGGEAGRPRHHHLRAAVTAAIRRSSTTGLRSTRAHRPGAVAPAADRRLQPAGAGDVRRAARASSWAVSFEVLYPTADEFERTGARIVASLDARAAMPTTG